MHRRANFRAERRFQDISQNLGNLWWHFTGYRRPSYFGLSRVLKEFIRIGRRVALCNLPERITHSRSNRPICELPAADAGYRAAGDGGHGHFGKAVVVGGELNGRRGNFGDAGAGKAVPEAPALKLAQCSTGHAVGRGRPCKSCFGITSSHHTHAFTQAAPKLLPYTIEGHSAECTP